MKIVQLPNKFKNIMSHIKNEDTVFIFWVKITPNEPRAKELLETLNEAIKASNRLIIYDVDRAMTEEEVNWILKNGGELYEPYIQTRKGFTYLPEPNNFDNHELKFETEPKEFFFGYYNKFPNRIMCQKLDINPVLTEGYNFSYTIALDTLDDYKYGHIHMELIESAFMGSKPLIPSEHRWFHGLVNSVGSPVCNTKDIDWYKKTSGESYGYCQRFLEDIQSTYPEFKLNYFKDVLNG